MRIAGKSITMPDLNQLAQEAAENLMDQQSEALYAFLGTLARIYPDLDWNEVELVEKRWTEGQTRRTSYYLRKKQDAPPKDAPGEGP